MSHASVAEILRGMEWRGGDEYALQAAVAARLEQLGAQAEVQLTRSDRIDFLAGSVGVECKVEGSPNSITRQLLRYAQCSQITSLVLVSSHLSLGVLPPSLAGKPLEQVFARRSIA